eukprot:TRINITY_DN9275_c0_g1_i1.p1 TRINITY_DN9275_c0_g1~~TRINITY_DN9275_c0_g1_i1.p1  ORF type:complete len:437 (+),score=100.97 TRINITY_DN9275_c0_g1_i1:124-1434(+)
MDLATFFEELDELKGATKEITPTKSVKSDGWLKNLKKGSGSKSKGEISTLEKLLIQVGKLKQSHETWAHVFYRNLQTHHTLTPHASAQQYRVIISNYIAATNTKELSPGTVIAGGLLQYLESHEDDPDNSMIGHAPSELVMTQLGIVTPTKKERLGTSDDIRESSLSYLNQTQMTFKELKQQVIKWSEMRDEKVVLYELRALAVHLVKEQPLNRGEIVLLCKVRDNDPPQYLYGRIKEHRNEEEVAITTHAYEDEGSVVIVPRSRVYPLNGGLRQYLQFPKQMEKLVLDPTDALYQVLMDELKTRCDAYLISNAIIPSAHTLSEWNGGNVAVSDLPALRNSLRHLRSLVEVPPQAFLLQLESYCSQEVETFYRNMDHSAFFIPTKQQSISILQRFASSRVTMAKQRFQVKPVLVKFDAISDFWPSAKEPWKLFLLK